MKAFGPLFCSLLCFGSVAMAGDDTVYREDKVSVRLERLDGPGPDIQRFRSSVEDGEACYSFFSGPFGGDPARARTLLAQVSGQDGYLFVPASCGGGNASKCQGYQVFSAKGGLRWLGYLTGRWNGSKALVYEDGIFFDTGDMLEINDLLSHAASPRYAMAYTEKKGLRFDPARTWALNAEAYARAGDDGPGLLFKAGLAKLCSRGHALISVRKAAARALSTAEQKAFERSLKQVRARDIRPNPFIPVSPCSQPKA